MKDYNEMAESVLKRRDKYMIERKQRTKRIAAAVSCFCLCALLGAGAWQGGMLSHDAAMDAGADGRGYGSGAIVSGGANIAEYSSATKEEKDMPSFEGDASAKPPNSFSIPAITSDAPVQNEAGNTGALAVPDGRDWETVWGGSYMDESGNWVVWLTEDTPENRAEVFQRNPSMDEVNTTFKKADYSLEYLTKLMTGISRAMGDARLTCVSSAALREDLNCVQVTVHNADAAEIANILAFDADHSGEAIEIIFGSANTAEDLPIQKGLAQ